MFNKRFQFNLWLGFKSCKKSDSPSRRVQDGAIAVSHAVAVEGLLGQGLKHRGSRTLPQGTHREDKVPPVLCLSPPLMPWPLCNHGRKRCRAGPERKDGGANWKNDLAKACFCPIAGGLRLSALTWLATWCR